MTLYKDTRIYHLSTRSQSGRIMNTNTNDKSDMMFNIPNMIDMTEENIEYAEFSINYAIIPVSFYNINSSNNTFCIQYYSQPSTGGVDATTSYTIPVGNYTALSMVIWWNANVPNFQMTFDPVSSIFSLLNNVQTFRIFSSVNDYVFGYTSSIFSTGWDNINMNATLTFTRMCNFLPTPRINIRCRELGNARMMSAVNSDEICCIIPNTSRPNQQIVYLNQAGIKSLVKIDRMNTFRVRITDDDNNLLQFNGVSCFFDFCFDVYYKTIPKLPSFRSIINTVNHESYRKLMMDIENYKDQVHKYNEKLRII